MKLCTTALVAFALSMAAAPGAVPLGATAPQEVAQTSESQHATEWPDAQDEAALKMAVKQVHKATSDEMEALGLATIKAEGAAAAPLLLRALSREKDDDAIERVTGALDTITTPKHTRLLAESFEERSAPLRRYSVRRAAALGDTGLRDQAEKLIEAFDKRAKTKRKKDLVEAVDQDLAAILAMSTGSPAGVERALNVAGSKAWSDWADTLNGAATSAKAAGTEVADEIAKSLAPGSKSKERVAALRLLTYAGTKDHARSVLPALDSNANHVKVAAVNALRWMVDGDPPIKKLSTFDAIERAEKWKKRL